MRKTPVPFKRFVCSISIFKKTSLLCYFIATLRPTWKDLTSLKEKVEHKKAQAKQSMGMQVLYIRHIVVGKKWAYIQEFFFCRIEVHGYDNNMCQKRLAVTQGFRTNHMSVCIIQFNLLKN